MAKSKSFSEPEKNFLFRLHELLGVDASSHRFLVAVSGGIDSVVLAYLMHAHGLQFGIAHVNFQLRGEESNQDAAFVCKLAQKYKVPFHEIALDTKKYASENGISTQMAARELRYAWFEKLQSSFYYDYLLTAHHSGDAVETMVINMLRGTGLSGLQGIHAKHGTILRPLIGMDREQILDIVAERQLSWREDSSNASTHYLRNYIRHDIIPLLEKKVENAKNMLALTAAHVSEAEQYILKQWSIWEKNYIQIKNGLIYMSFEGIVEPHTYIAKRYLMHLGFRKTQLQHILSGNANVGAQFYTPLFKLTIDRSQFCIESISLQDAPKEHYVQDADGISHLGTSHLVAKIIPNLNSIPKHTPITEVFIQKEKLKFPLKLRKWKEGDRIMPLGMKQYKKVSDVLIDNKIPRPQKDQTWVLLSEDQIVWIVGIQLSDAFKINDLNQPIFHVQLHHNEN